MSLKFSINIPDELLRREPRYSCGECCDSGWVKVFHPETVAAAAKNADSVKRWRCCVVRCSCETLGPDNHRLPEAFRAGPRIKTPLPVFGDHAWHINANKPDSKATAAMYVHRPPNFNHEFAQYETADCIS